MQIEMTIKGLMVDPITNMPIIILRDKDGQRVLPIWVGVFEANAIALQIENVTTPRPMTHDLLRNVIHDLKADILKIVVSDLKENTFYALIHLQVNGEPLAVDARPSDAIALARTDQVTDELALEPGVLVEVEGHARHHSLGLGDEHARDPAAGCEGEAAVSPESLGHRRCRVGTKPAEESHERAPALAAVGA